MRAVGRSERGAVPLEVVVNDKFVVIPGKDQVRAGSFVIGVEQKLGVGNDDGIGRRVDLRGIHMHIRVRMRSRAFMVKRGVEFASVIQRATAKG
jgi:hypothetical protein